VEPSRKKSVSAWKTLFGSPIRAFGIVSVLLVLVLAIAPAKNHFSQWRHYQKGYLALIHARGDANTLQRHFHPDIQQIWLPEVGAVDRCSTCHEGLKEASLEDVTTQPFTRHPVIPHSAEQFGCVLCHRGQGAATTVAEAHHSELAGEEPILPARYVQSSCGQCHHSALTGTPQLNVGRNMLARNGCVRCHTVKLPDGSAMMAADNPPSLVHVADKTTREWIYAWLKDPLAYAISATMPDFKLSDGDAADISAFLISNSVPAAGDSAPVTESKSTADPVAGPSLYGESFCASCHATQNAAGNVVGGDIGPELTHIGNKVKPEWLQVWLRNPRIYDHNTPMPHYRFNDQQIALLSGFLAAKADSSLLANIHLDAATPAQIAHGKLLVTEYGCASCHEITGIKKSDNFAPELSRIGSKPISQLAFLPGMQHTLPDYISAKVRQPRAFGGALKMPQYTFTPTQVDALTTELLSLTDRSHNLPPSLAVASAPISHYRPAGNAGALMEELACQSCHRINGRGGDMAPDLTLEGSAVQRAWLNDFLKNPNTLRPSLIRRMPRFNLTDGERAELTDYMMTVYQSPAIDRDSMPLTGYSAAEVEQGKQLFYSKYACQSCHIVDSKADKGYIGPTLSQVGSRLNAAWIYAWLKNPQALRQDTAQPDFNMSDEDARALTAFLETQKGTSKQEAKR
jgi:mono/diheme cytochrome c family protein